MRKSTITAAAAAVACLGAGQAAAAERLTDTAYLAAVRCQGLAEARQIDASALQASLKVQKRGRDPYISDLVRRQRRTAEQDGSSENLTRKARVDAELAGACQAHLGGASAFASAPNTGG